jgi:hypothetical protein
MFACNCLKNDKCNESGEWNYARGRRRDPLLNRRRVVNYIADTDLLTTLEGGAPALPVTRRNECRSQLFKMAAKRNILLTVTSFAPAPIA